MTTNDLKFGTDGIRGRADAFPFTDNALKKLGKAIALWHKSRHANPRSCLLIHDTRSSCYRIKRALAAGLATDGIECIDGEVLPTPAASIILKTDSRFSLALIISASHNPAEDNGIKFVNAKGEKISQNDEKEIIRLFNASTQEKCNPISSLTVDTSCKKAYISHVLSHFEAGMLEGKRIVLDCANGATHEVAPAIFEALGAKIVTLGVHPNGSNINKHCGSLYPKLLSEEVIGQKADLGIAFDGDGDRTLLVSPDGTIIDGDNMLALLLEHPRYASTPSVVGTIMTNHGFSVYLSSLGKTLHRTKVGDKHVAAMLREKNLLLGGETSGHIILADYAGGGDGIFSSLTCLESTIKNDNIKLITFSKYPQVHINVPVGTKQNLLEKPCCEVIDCCAKELTDGRLVVRYSGTENVLRIMAEDQDKEKASLIAAALADRLQPILSIS